MLKRIYASDNPNKDSCLNKYFWRKNDELKKIATCMEWLTLLFGEQDMLSRTSANFSRWGGDVDFAEILLSKSKKTHSSHGHGDQDDKKRKRPWDNSPKDNKRDSDNTKGGGGKGSDTGKGSSSFFLQKYLFKHLSLFGLSLA